MTTPDFPPEVIEKAAQALGDHCADSSDEKMFDGVWTFVVCCECGEEPPMDQYDAHIARAVLAAVADDLRAEGARQAGDAIEAAIDALPTVVSTVGPDGWPAADHTAYQLYLDALRLLPKVAREAVARIEKGRE